MNDADRKQLRECAAFLRLSMQRDSGFDGRAATWAFLLDRLAAEPPAPKCAVCNDTRTIQVRADGSLVGEVRCPACGEPPALREPELISPEAIAEYIVRGFEACGTHLPQKALEELPVILSGMRKLYASPPVAPALREPVAFGNPILFKPPGDTDAKWNGGGMIVKFLPTGDYTAPLYASPPVAQPGVAERPAPTWSQSRDFLAEFLRDLNARRSTYGQSDKNDQVILDQWAAELERRLAAPKGERK